jgi:transcriptional regulator with XRE-family HTH domain
MADSTVDWPSLIAEFRRARGLKQDAVAHDLGVSQATVSRWESGASTPCTAMQNKLFRHARQARSPFATLHWAETFRRLLAPGVVISADKLVSLVNNPLAERLGIPTSEIEGQDFEQAFSGEVIETRRRAIECGVHAGRVASYEGCSHVKLNSQLAKNVSFHVHYVGWPYFSDDGEIAAVQQGVFVSPVQAAEIRGRLGGLVQFTLAA